MPSWILLAILAGIVLLYLMRLHNRLATLHRKVEQAWSGMDVLLKQRHEHIAALTELCKRHMPDEAEVLSTATRLRDQAETARTNGDTASLSGREQALNASWAILLVRAEAYSELQEAEAFQHLMARMAELDMALPNVQAKYNDAVTVNNRRQQHFPETLLSRLFGFRPRAPFEIDPAERP